jgi:glycosyltransferase involved in cell wall biosynthesis
MGTLNAELLVGAALASIRDQTLTNHDVIVVDAASSDGTADVVAACAAEDDRIRLTRSPVRLNCPESRNAALPGVTSPFVAFLDHDDLMDPTRLEVQVAALAADPNLVAIGGRLRRMDQYGLPVGSGSATTSRPLTPATIEFAMPFTCPFLASSAVVRTDALRRIGGFDAGVPLADDYDVWWRLSLYGRLKALDHPVGWYRVHATQISTATRNRQRLALAMLQQRIASQAMKRAVALSTILLSSHVTDHMDEARRRQAQADLTEYHEMFQHHRDLSQGDRRWITAFVEMRQQRLARGA